MKKIIFALIIITCFQGNISFATNVAKNTKFKFQNLKDSLNSTNIDEKNKKFIIDYFNQPGSGIPVCTKNQPKPKSKKTRISKIIKLLNLLFSKSPQYPSKLKIDELGMAIALKLRKHTKISLDMHIPVFTKFKFSLNKKLVNTFCSNYNFSNYFNYVPSDIAYNVKFPYIMLDSLLNKLLHHTIPFRLAHELAHIEMKDSIIRKIVSLGLTTALLSYIFLAHKKCNKLTSIIGSIGSYLLSAFLLNRGYFQQQVEKACDLRAIELIKSDVGVDDFFSHELAIDVIFSNNDWIIAEIILIFDKPREYTTWKEWLFSSHPSNAERIRYCKAFAQKRGYTHGSLNSLFL